MESSARTLEPSRHVHHEDDKGMRIALAKQVAQMHGIDEHDKVSARCRRDRNR